MVVTYNLPRRQRDVLRFIIENISAKDESPTLKEIASGCSMGLGQAQKTVEALVKKGKIKKDIGQFRSIIVID